MKRNVKKVLAATLCLSMLGTGMLAVNAEETAGGYQVNEELAALEGQKLNVYGPGIFSIGGAEGSVDLLTGVEIPSYNVIIERWNELYPNCELTIEAIPWDSWQTNITTACLSGEVDIISHGATMIDITEDLAPYLEAEPEYREQIYQTASRITTDDMSKYKVSGISVAVSPIAVWLDKEKFEHYGIELPSADWTYEDMLSLAEQLTGTDPVTGEQTYGFQYYAAGTANLWYNHSWWANYLGADIFQYNTNIKDTVVDYTCEASIQAFQMAADLAQYAAPEVREGVSVNTTIDGTNSWAMFANSGYTTDWKNIAASGLEDRYVCINLPICQEGRYAGLPIPCGGDNNIAIYNGSDNKELAWEFVKFMTTDEVAVEWVADQLMIPNNSAGMEYVKELLPEHVVSVVDYVMGSVPENYNDATNYVFNSVSFGPTTNNMITAVDNVINAYMTAEEAAQLMQDGIDEFLASVE